MGRKLDKLLGRTWKKTPKLKALLGLTVSRLAVLRNQRGVRAAQARDEVANLLQINNQDRALLLVEQVIKEQNMLDVSVMIDGYCRLLIERAYLFEQHKDCPEELREAVSSLLFAASRCGDLPELQDVRKIFSDKFGKDFVAAAIELRNNSSVINTKMIQKLSTRQESLDSRIRMAKEIAAERGIAIVIEEPSPPESPEVTQEQNRFQNWSPPDSSSDQSSPLDAGKKYKDVVSAAQAAFESAQYAAVAARAAVELSRAESQGKSSGSDDSNRGSKNSGRGKSLNVNVTSKNKVEPFQIYDSDGEEVGEEEQLYRKINRNARTVQLETSLSMSSSSSSSTSVDSHTVKPKRSDQVKFDDSESETEENNSGTETKGLNCMNNIPPYCRSTDTIAQSSLAKDTSRMGLRSETGEKTPVSYTPGRRFSSGNLYQNAENELNMKQTGFQKAASVRTRR